MAYSVGQTVAAATVTAVAGADSIVTAAAVVDLPASSFDGQVSVACDAQATLYLYAITALRVVTAVHGPFHCRSFEGLRPLLERGMAAQVAEVTEMTGTEVILHAGKSS